MAVTVKRPRFAGTYLAAGEYAAVLRASRLRDLSLAGLLRRAAVHFARRVIREEAARARQQSKAAEARRLEDRVVGVVVGDQLQEVKG